jgi:hypothetical protein
MVTDKFTFDVDVMSETLTVECVEHNEGGVVKYELEITGPEGGYWGAPEMPSPFPMTMVYSSDKSYLELDFIEKNWGPDMDELENNIGEAILEHIQEKTQ